MNDNRISHHKGSVQTAVRPTRKAALGANLKSTYSEPIVERSERTGTIEKPLQLKLFLRHECSSCSEQAVAQEVRQLHHVRRVQTHPDRHEIDVWIAHPEHGLMRDIGGILDLFCCQLAACHLR